MSDIIKDTIKAQIAVSLEFEFMGADLSASYSISDDGMTISFSGEVKNADHITPSAMVNDFNELMEEPQLSEEQVLQSIKGNICNLQPDIVTNIDFSKLKFRLKELRLRLFIGKDGRKTVDYAITLEIILDGMLPDIKVIHIKSLNFSLKNNTTQWW